MSTASGSLAALLWAHFVLGARHVIYNIPLYRCLGLRVDVLGVFSSSFFFFLWVFVYLKVFVFAMFQGLGSFDCDV